MKEFVLNFLWLDKSIAVSLDQRVEGGNIPLTEYYFWPKHDAWEEVRIYLSNCAWISEYESIVILNNITEVINYWQAMIDSERIKEFSNLSEVFPSSRFYTA